jgi:large conductance mechanosensitive channel
MTILQEFKQFAIRGNVIDMAVGIVIGLAFGKIVSSLVSDIIMPPIGQLMGNVDFSNLFITLGPGAFENLAAAQRAGAATINYGVFINTVLDFLIVAFAIFLLVKAINKLKREEPAPAPDTRQCPECLSSDIPIAARRCRHCTSELSPSA